MAATTKDTTQPKLALSRGAPPQKFTLYLFVHFLYIFLPRLFITLPLGIFYHHAIMRWRSSVVQVIGRPWYSDFVAQLSAYYLGRASVAETRLLFNRTQAYDMVHAGPHFSGYRDWVSYVKVNGTAGRWLAPPNTKRADDEVVFFYIHGGGFVMDTSGNAQIFLLKLAKEMHLKRGVKFSVFALDYELAPEYKYPSQLIETLAAYHYLVNTLGISEDKIVIGGDSAGGNLTTAFMLHLARPNPNIFVPAEFGPTPKRPASVLLISPFTKLISHNPSRKANVAHDLIDNGGSFTAALDYIGAKRPTGTTPVPSFNPIHLLTLPHPHPPRGIVKSAKGFTAAKEGKGLELFSSPYVNPSVCEDLEWWNEAFPDEGRTMITWGGKEILCDDIVELFGVMTKAGVAPTPLCKPLGVHDWILFDYFIPGFYKTNSKGPDSRLSWGMDSVAEFFQSTDRRVRAQSWEAKASARKAEDEAQAVEAAAIVEAESKAAKVLEEATVEAEVSVEESVVIVEPVVEPVVEVVDEVSFRPRGAKKGKGRGGI